MINMLIIIPIHWLEKKKTVESTTPFNSTTLSQFLTTLTKRPFENIVGKGENAGNQHFLLFPQCFLPTLI